MLRGGIAQGVPYTANISDLLCITIYVLIISDWFARALGSNQQTPSSGGGEIWQEMKVNFAYEVSLLIPVEFSMP
jgi:hypothetical protein